MEQEEEKLREELLKQILLLTNDNKPDKDYYKINALKRYDGIHKNEYVYRQYITII
tara:strand:- start:347 stop:514 length:168 start_codon:yes stop_codon:yes gene_type:complete